MHIVRPLALTLLFALLSVVWGAQPSLDAYQARLPVLQRQIPAVAASAQQAAENNLQHPTALINMPYWEQVPFSEEMLNRAGGLAHAFCTEARPTLATAHDIVVLSVRSWEQETETILKRVTEYKKQGWTVTIIGSKAGKPADLGADFFIDNGAPSEKADQGRINVLANITLGWMWCCEYAAAMSRQGKFPAVLYSVAMPGAQEYDEKIQSAEGRFTLVPCDTPIPGGELAQVYLARVEKLVADCASERIQGQLLQAADVVAARLRAGETVGVSGLGHAILEEVKTDNKTPWKGFQAVGSPKTAYKANLKPGELLVWIAYCGMNSAYDDYGKYIQEAGVDLVTCYAPDPEWAVHAPKDLAHIDQCWTLPDAEVPIPVFPHKMAPVSGINSCLILRMLDDEVAKRLSKK
ncbi:MAG: hypothetical protein ACYDCO_23150 [Armatimonadota bacterium]